MIIKCDKKINEKATNTYMRYWCNKNWIKKHTERVNDNIAVDNEIHSDEYDKKKHTIYAKLHKYSIHRWIPLIMFVCFFFLRFLSLFFFVCYQRKMCWYRMIVRQSFILFCKYSLRFRCRKFFFDRSKW